MSIYNFNPDEEKTYNIILQATNNLDREAVVPSLAVDELLSIFRKVLCESPNGYLYDQSKIIAAESFCKTRLKFNFCENIQERIRIDIRIIPELYEIIGNANKERNIQNKIRYVYSYFTKNFKYAYEDSNNPKFHNTISPFIYRKAVCDGFAQCFAFILNAMKIPCGIVTGFSNLRDSNGPHAWNIVRIGDNYYHLDVTWDICLNSESDYLFDYFLLDDNLSRKNHVWTDVTIPKANDLSLEDYTRMNLTAKTKRNCLDIITSSLKQKKETISYRYLGSDTHIALTLEQTEHLFDKAVHESGCIYRKVSYSSNTSSGTARFNVVY